MLSWAGAGWLHLHGIRDGSQRPGSGEDAHALGHGHDPIGIAKQQQRCLLGRTPPALCASSCADAKLDRAYIVVASVRAPGRASHRVRVDARTPLRAQERLPQGTTSCQQPGGPPRPQIRGKGLLAHCVT